MEPQRADPTGDIADRAVREFAISKRFPNVVDLLRGTDQHTEVLVLLASDAFGSFAQIDVRGFAHQDGETIG